MIVRVEKTALVVYMCVCICVNIYVYYTQAICSIFYQVFSAVTVEGELTSVFSSVSLYWPFLFIIIQLVTTTFIICVLMTRNC